jgi:hypothetical protein
VDTARRSPMIPAPKREGVARLVPVTGECKGCDASGEPCVPRFLDSRDVPANAPTLGGAALAVARVVTRPDLGSPTPGLKAFRPTFLDVEHRDQRRGPCLEARLVRCISLLCVAPANRSFATHEEARHLDELVIWHDFAKLKPLEK